jgi:hypothetical protein
MFNHQLNPLDSCLKDQSECFFADPIENFSDQSFQSFPGVRLEVVQFSFYISKEEEVTWSKVRIIRRMGQRPGFGGVETISRQLPIGKTCIAQVGQNSIQGFLAAMGSNVVN